MLDNILRNQNALMLIVRIFVLLVCFPVHECAHAWVADRLGDSTGREMGRITLNPFRHLDYMGTIFILLIGVGYAKPVPVNISRFRHRKREFALTALAGPVSNLMMTVLFLFIIKALPLLSIPAEYLQLATRMLTYAAYINVSLAVFNLLPIPPLDGSRVVMALLPDNAYNNVLRKERYVMGIVLIAIMAFNRMGYSPIGFLSNRVFHFLYSVIVI